MPAPGIKQITYRYIKPRMDPLKSSEVEALIRDGNPYGAKCVKTRLMSSDEPRKATPQFEEFWLLMEGRGDGLTAVFRPFMGGIEENFSPAPPPTHGRKHYAAYIVSMTAGIEVVPITAIRDFSNIANFRECPKGSGLWRLSKAGQGTLTAMIDGSLICGVDANFNAYLRTDVPYRQATLMSTYIFDMLVGSGQRDFSSYMADKDGCVRSRLHHEAWTYSAQEKLAKLIQQTTPEIQRGFWDALMNMREFPLKRNRLRDLLTAYIGLEQTQTFLDDLSAFLTKSEIAGVQIQKL